MDQFTCDVLVVGGGGAGLRAVIAVAETHPKLRVAVISKVYPMRSHTVSAEGGAAAVIKAGDSLDAHAYDTISGGDWLSDQDAVEAFVREAPEEMLRITARAVILATGGWGKVFPCATNGNSKNGDGMALGYRAGAPLKDVEF